MPKRTYLNETLPRKFTLPSLQGIPSEVSHLEWLPPKVKKIALVWPYGYDPAYSIPLPFGYLKSNLDESRYEIKLIDNTILNRRASDSSYAKELEEFNPNIVGVSTWSPMFEEALMCLERAREVLPNIITCIGGAHATSYYKKFAGRCCRIYCCCS